MRDDLLDAKAAIDWAVAQLPVLNNRIDDWKKTSPYAAIRECDIEGFHYCLTVGESTPLPRTVQAEAGAIINSLRSSLDLAAATCVRAIGIQPNIYTHFPFFSSEAHFRNATDGLESPKYKRWISKDDRSVIEAVRPYDGPDGNALLCALHQLDILRKHERFIGAYPTWRLVGVMGAFGSRFNAQRGEMRPPSKFTRLNGETVVTLIADRMADGHPHASFDVLFNEPAFLVREPVIKTMEKIAVACEDVLVRFK